MRAWRKRHAGYIIKLRLKHKIKVLMKYCRGRIRCQCKGCPIKHISLLTIDHRKPIKKLRGRAGPMIISWIIGNNFPKGFQILCGSCNLAKGVKSRCPRYGKKH